MRELPIAAVLVLLLAGGALRAQTPQMNAGQLASATASALGDISRLAQAPKSGIDPARPQHAAFLAALQHLRIRVNTLVGVDPHGDPFLLGVDLGSSDLGALRVAWARAGVSNPGIAERLRAASSSYRRLRTTYGREGVRQRQGGALSEAERRQFERIQRSQRRLAASLRTLRDQARRQGDRAAAAELERFRAEAERVALAPASLESYLNSLISASEMRGEWQADASYVRKAASAEPWAAADRAVEDLYVDSDYGQVFTLSLGKTGGAGPGDGDGDGGEAVQVFQPGEGEEPAAADLETAEAAGPEDGEAGSVEAIEFAAAPLDEAGAVDDIDLVEPEAEAVDAADFAGVAEDPAVVEPAAAPEAVEPPASPAPPPAVTSVEPPAPPPIG